MAGSGAPAGNTNTEKHGLYARQPLRLVTVAPDVDLIQLAEYAQTMGDYALWIAEALDAVMMIYEGLEAHTTVALYATVAQEMNQLAGELAGETGIKAAALGTLSDDMFERLLVKQARALELILNQCMAAGRRIQQAEEIIAAARDAKNGAIKNPVLQLGGGLILLDDGIAIINPVLASLAGHMRKAKRVLREAAANRAWKLRGADDTENDLSVRIQRQIGGQ